MAAKKFRAWDSEINKMIYDFSEYKVTMDDGELKVSFGGSIINFEPLQYIGVKAIGGVELCEGDIVKWDDGSSGKYWRVAIVRLNPDIQFEIIKNSLHPLSSRFPYSFHFGNFAYAQSTEENLHHIGNIYENPEIQLKP